MLRAFLGFPGRLWRAFLERQIRAAHDAALRLDVKDNLVRMLNPAVPLSLIATKDQELDFVKWRSPTYVPPMSDGVVDETVLALQGRNRPEPFDAMTLARMSLGCPLAYLLQRDGDDWVVDFAGVTLFPYRPLTVAQFRFNLEQETFSIIDIGGKTHRPGEATWETAVTHAMAWATIAVPTGAHNWVHFALPDAAASAHERLSRSESNVARLLAPHVRFTNRINYQALWIQRSTANAPTFGKALVPWLAVPFFKDQFRGGILYNTQRHYRNLARHFDLPDQLDPRIPYFAFLRAYYEVIERFAHGMEAELEDDAWQELSGLIDRELPGFAAVPRAKALAVLIWQVGVVHICDHLTYYPFALAHGFTRTPPSLFSRFRRLDVGRWDRWKTRNFLHAFVNFNASPGLDQRLLNVDAYGFAPGSAAAQKAQQFKAELMALDARLAAEGRAMVPADRLIQSICF